MAHPLRVLGVVLAVVLAAAAAPGEPATMITVEPGVVILPLGARNQLAEPILAVASTSFSFP